MSYVLGIDGGGTKTIGVIANKQGEIIIEAMAGATNPNLITKKELVNTFSNLISRLKEKDMDVFEKVTHLFAGVSGTGHPKAQRAVYHVLTELLPELKQISVDNDAIIALYSGTLGRPGIVQISGTGSITYGINHYGNRKRIGGWGHFVGEKGSGYGLGHDALKASFAFYDGMGQATILSEKLLDYFKEVSLPDLIPRIYQSTNPKETVASIAKLVMEAADNDDQVAKEIIRDNGRYIGKSVVMLIRTLFEEATGDVAPIPVVLAGGLCRRIDLFEAPIREELSHLKREVTLIKPEGPPIVGAIVAALSMVNRSQDV